MLVNLFPIFVSHTWGAVHPASREFEVGDRSDQDCVVSQPVRSLRCDFQAWENRRHLLPTEGGVFLDESLLHEFSISGI